MGCRARRRDRVGGVPPPRRKGLRETNSLAKKGKRKFLFSSAAAKTAKIFGVDVPQRGRLMYTHTHRTATHKRPFSCGLQHTHTKLPPNRIGSRKHTLYNILYNNTRLLVSKNNKSFISHYFRTRLAIIIYTTARKRLLTRGRVQIVPSGMSEISGFFSPVDPPRTVIPSTIKNKLAFRPSPL